MASNHLENINLSALDKLAETHEPISYAKLCSRLGIKYLTSDSKQSQLDMLNTICLYHKESNKYIIDEYYSSFAPSMCNGKSKYVPYIEAVLCSLLKIDEEAFLTSSEILLACKIINDNFTKARNRKNRLAICNKQNYEIVDFDCFVDNTYTKILLPIVRSALLSLQRRKVISIAESYRYKIEISKDIIVVKNAAYGSEIFQQLLEVEYEAKELLKIQDKKYLNVYEADEYYRVCNMLAKDKYGIISFYNSKQIVTKKEIVTKELNKLCSELNIAVGDKVMNSKYLDSLTGEFKKMMVNDMLSLDPGVSYSELINH